MPYIVPLIPFLLGTIVQVAAAINPDDHRLRQVASRFKEGVTKPGVVALIFLFDLISLTLIENYSLIRDKIRQFLTDKGDVGRALAQAEGEDEANRMLSPIKDIVSIGEGAIDILTELSRVVGANHRTPSSQPALMRQFTKNVERLQSEIERRFDIAVPHDARAAGAAEKIKTGSSLIVITAFTYITLCIGVVKTEGPLLDDAAYGTYAAVSQLIKMLAKSSNVEDLLNFFAYAVSVALLGVPISALNAAFVFMGKEIFSVVSPTNTTGHPFSTLLSGEEQGISTGASVASYLTAAIVTAVTISAFSDKVGAPAARAAGKIPGLFGNVGSYVVDHLPGRRTGGPTDDPPGAEDASAPHAPVGGPAAAAPFQGFVEGEVEEDAAEPAAPPSS